MQLDPRSFLGPKGVKDSVESLDLNIGRVEAEAYTNEEWPTGREIFSFGAILE